MGKLHHAQIQQMGMLQRGMADMLQHMSEMSTRAAAPQQINLQIQNEATVRHDGPMQPRKSVWELALLAWREFWASPINRLGLLATVSAGGYLLHKHMEHRWRMTEMQKRIDANFVLKANESLRQWKMTRYIHQDLPGSVAAEQAFSLVFFSTVLAHAAPLCVLR